MKLRELRVKVKSLAAEQVIIQHEERAELKSQRWKRNNGELSSMQTHESLRWHRVYWVRTEIRSTLIAYGLLRGRTLEQIEQPRSAESLKRKPYRDPNWKRIEALIKKYGDKQALETFVMERAA